MNEVAIQKLLQASAKLQEIKTEAWNSLTKIKIWQVMRFYRIIKGLRIVNKLQRQIDLLMIDAVAEKPIIYQSLMDKINEIYKTNNN